MCQQSQGSWYQAGIVSFGIGCAEKDVPAVYADVAYAACWIDQEVGCHFTEMYIHQLKTIFRCQTIPSRQSRTSGIQRRTVPTTSTVFFNHFEFVDNKEKVGVNDNKFSLFHSESTFSTLWEFQNKSAEPGRHVVRVPGEARQDVVHGHVGHHGPGLDGGAPHVRHQHAVVEPGQRIVHRKGLWGHHIQT